MSSYFRTRFYPALFFRLWVLGLHKLGVFQRFRALFSSIEKLSDLFYHNWVEFVQCIEQNRPNLCNRLYKNRRGWLVRQWCIMDERVNQHAGTCNVLIKQKICEKGEVREVISQWCWRDSNRVAMRSYGDCRLCRMLWSCWCLDVVNSSNMPNIRCRGPYWILQ